MPLIGIHVIRGSSAPEPKLQMMQEATEMVGWVLAEPVKKRRWVRIIETGEDEWMIGGGVFTPEHARRLRAGQFGS